MKIKESDNYAKSGGALETIEFGIHSDDMGQLLEILRSRMYSDPIGSICREVISNCRDANREVGKGDVPPVVRVERPDHWTEGDRFISFIDEGPGISPDRMSNVFCKYAASTKRHTNEFTGGFGLGAKTPFSYTDNFTIITKVDGIKYTYVAAIDSTRKGQIILLEKSQTDEPNGTEIKIPVLAESDLRQFESSSVVATAMWQVKPIFENFSPWKHSFSGQMLLHGDGYRIFESDSGVGEASSWWACIDGILYSIDNRSGKLPFASMGSLRISGINAFVVLDFKNGDLTVSSNRENLYLDEDTVNKLIRASESVKSDIMISMNETMEHAQTYREACILRDMFVSGPSYESAVTGVDTAAATKIGHMYRWLMSNSISISIGSHIVWRGSPIAQSSSLIKRKEVEIKQIDVAGNVVNTRIITAHPSEAGRDEYYGTGIKKTLDSMPLSHRMKKIYFSRLSRDLFKDQHKITHIMGTEDRRPIVLFAPEPWEKATRVERKTLLRSMHARTASVLRRAHLVAVHTLAGLGWEMIDLDNLVIPKPQKEKRGKAEKSSIREISTWVHAAGSSRHRNYTSLSQVERKHLYHRKITLDIENKTASLIMDGSKKEDPFSSRWLILPVKDLNAIDDHFITEDKSVRSKNRLIMWAASVMELNIVFMNVVNYERYLKPLKSRMKTTPENVVKKARKMVGDNAVKDIAKIALVLDYSPALFEHKNGFPARKNSSYDEDTDLVWEKLRIDDPEIERIKSIKKITSEADTYIRDLLNMSRYNVSIQSGVSVKDRAIWMASKMTCPVDWKDDIEKMRSVVELDKFRECYVSLRNRYPMAYYVLRGIGGGATDLQSVLLCIEDYIKNIKKEQKEV